MANIIIDSTPTQNGLLFFIVSGVTSAVSYRWYLNDDIVGYNSTYLLTTSVYLATVYVIVDQKTGESVWHDGEFYGGTFGGQFLGGTFYYGTLNGVHYPHQDKKPKTFIT